MQLKNKFMNIIILRAKQSFFESKFCKILILDKQEFGTFVCNKTKGSLSSKDSGSIAAFKRKQVLKWMINH